MKQIKILQTFCPENGLRMRYDSTEDMIGNIGIKYDHMKIPDSQSSYTAEIVDEYKYLGMWINTKKLNKEHTENSEK